ncbi:hypothetical protein L7F22_005128 [Adiantum nelumboides]|nr:hypothetical protein [Adiantum nelumboides]
MHHSDTAKTHGPHQHCAISADGISSPCGQLHKEYESAAQQHQRPPTGKQIYMENLLGSDIAEINRTDGMHAMDNRHQTTKQTPSAVVFSPRVPGEEPSLRDRSLRSVSPTLIREILEKSGMAFKIPNFLERASRDTREIWKTKFKPRPGSPGLHRPSKTIRLKSTAPGLVTVPLSAKQWLLLSLGLKDSEIYELFHQMESMPQFAAEYIREVKDEWQALELREKKRPPEVEYLSKDQALLEKVRALISRVARAHEYEESCVRQQEGQRIREKDNNVSCSRARSPSRSLLMQAEKYKHAFQYACKGENVRPDYGTLLGSPDKLDDPESTRPVVCSSCGQVKLNLPDVDSQQVLPATTLVERELASQPRHVLPSFIPVDDYIVEHRVVQPEPYGKVEHKSRFNPLDKRWYTVLFPALQPGKREDVQLLGEWLQHSMHRNCHENSDGQFEDAEAAFVLHSIAFLEIVRQIDLQCEERGNLLLHVWRQILRVFNQVMTAAEPYFDAKEDELKHTKNHMDTMNEQINSLLNQLEESNKQLKEKEAQVQKVKRCRLCLCENVTPRSRDDIVKKAKTKASLLKRTSQAAHSEGKKEEEALDTSKRSEMHEISRKPTVINENPVIQESIEEESVRISSSAPHVDESKEGLTKALPYSLQESCTEDLMPDAPDVKQVGTRNVGHVDATTQTLEKMSKFQIVRSESAPARLESNFGDAPSLTGYKVQAEVSSKVRVPGEQVKVAEEEADFLKLLGPPAPGSIPIPGTIIGAAIDRLQNFESLALQTLSLLEKLPKVVEGNLATTIQSLTETYCKLTGYVLKQPEKEIRETDLALESEGDGLQENEADSEKGKKKGQGKTGKTIQAKFFVPTSFSKMMKINSVPKNLKTFNIRQVIWENIGTRLQFSSSFHPQTDRQSEIADSVVLDLLKSYISDQKTQWEKYLPLAEFAYNNTIRSSTEKAPFEIVEGAMKVPPFLSTKDKIFEADEYTRDLDTAFAKVCETLQKSQERQKKAADRHRRDLKLKENDWISERINNVSFRLRLPDTWKIHNAFHVSLLKPFKGDVPDDGEPDEQPEVEENEEILVSEQILAHKDTKTKGILRAGNILLYDLRNGIPDNEIDLFLTSLSAGTERRNDCSILV